MPEHLTLATCGHGDDHEAWRSRFGDPQARDVYDLQVAELSEVRLPGGTAMERDAFITHYRGRDPGTWSYYPWLNTVVRTVGRDSLYELRTNRNRNLVTLKEQEALHRARVAVAGLSVGSNILSCLAHNGIGHLFSLADHDDVATSNLNRTQGRVLDVGVPKCDLGARTVLEIDPFAECALYRHGLNDGNVDAFTADSDIIFDEVDDFRLKVQLRIHAQRHAKPLLMATNLGDFVLVDVERWDCPEDGLTPFAGQLDGVSVQDLMQPGLPAEHVSRFAAQVVGTDNVPLRALASLPLINRELAGRPQLASTASVAAGIAAMVTRCVLLGAPVRSGRYRFSLPQTLRLPDDLGTPGERAAILARLQPARPATGARPRLHTLEALASDTPRGSLSKLAAYATLAPSPHNTQPWLFRADGTSLTILPDASRWLAIADPQRRSLAISLGCSAMSALVAAAAARLDVDVTVCPADGVRLTFSSDTGDHDLAGLFPVLTSRVSDKRPYQADEAEPPTVPLPDGIAVRYLNGIESRARVAGLHRQAVTGLARTNAFSAELANWLRTGPGDPRRDGMTLPLPPSAAEVLIAALATSGEPLREMGERDAEALASGPVIGVLTSTGDTENAWVKVGLAWQRLSLAAHASGLATAPLTAVVENPRTRDALSHLVASHQYVQMLFRLGRPAGPLAPTARRDPTLAGS